MPNDYITNVKVDGTTYDIKDTVSGYTTNTGTVTGVTAGTGLSGGTISTSGTISLDTTRALTTSDITTGTDTTNKLVSAKTIADALGGLGGGTVTSVGITNGGGLTVSGSPVTTSGSITVGHSNSVTAQNTQGVYPVTIDSNGHIASYGTKEDIFKVFTIDTSNDYDISDLQNLNTFGVSISSSDVAALDAVYDTKKVALQLIVSDDGDEFTIMGYSTGERFSFTYNETLTFSNIMKFTFAGDYANSLMTLALSKSEFVGCIYVIPECNVSAYANRLCLRGVPIGDALTSVITTSTIDGWCPDGGGAYSFNIVDGAGDSGLLFYNEKSPHYVLAGPSSGSSANYPSFRALVADDIPSLTVSKISDMPTIPSAGTTATAVSTTASGGSASTYSKSDHVHSLSSSTVTSALGYTPYNSTNPDGYTTNTGTVTSVQVQATSPIVSSVNTAQSGTLNTTISHANSGVTAGTYNSVTVDAMGHVTAGTNASDVFLVTGTLTSVLGGTTDKSASEIYAASQAGKVCVFTLTTNGTPLYATLSVSTNSYAAFTYDKQDDPTLCHATIAMSGADAKTFTFTAIGYPFITGIDSSDVVAALGYTPYDNTNPNGYTSNTGTITGVSVNNTSVATSGVANIQLKTINGNAITGTGDITVSSSDTNVTNTLDTTTKYYLTGTTSSTTNTGTQIFDTGIYSTTTAGQLNATTYKVNEQVTIQWNSTDSSLDFIF